jgi:hypothetical protein
MKKYILISLALGIVYRAFLLSSFPQPFLADQIQYHDIALGILKDGIFVSSNRTYGYPMIIAVWYSLFGVGNVLAWTLIQVCMDALVALCIYFITKDIFGKKLPAIIAFTLYCISPFVAAYAGMLLSEVSAVFFMALLFLFWHKFFKTKKIIYLIVASFFMGYIPEIRPAFYYFMVGLFVVTVFMVRKMNIPRWGWALVVVFFLLPFSYAYIGNYVVFQRISPLVADNGGIAHELLSSVHLESRAPHPLHKPGSWPDRIGRLGWELGFPYEQTYRDNLKKEHMKEALVIIKKDPVHFLRVRLNKAWYVWEKKFLFIFTEEPKFIEYAANIFNTFLLLSAGGGIVLFLMQTKTFHQRIFLWMSITLIGYTSVIHMISTAEPRYSLPAYPILFIFSGYALSEIYTRVCRMLYQRNRLQY